jgi:DNA-binding response OmpR family regulator
MVLCIDDDATILELHKSLLETKGYTVLTAPDGLAGVALARTNCLDAVVLDFKMPGMDGNQVAEVLMKEHPNLPVLICSGCPFEVPESLKWFASAYLEKGDGPKVLLSALEELTQASETNRRIAKSRQAA